MRVPPAIVVAARELVDAHQVPPQRAVGLAVRTARNLAATGHPGAAAAIAEWDDAFDRAVALAAGLDAQVVELAAVNGQHVPGTAYNWRHGWHPLNVQTALLHGKKKAAKKLHDTGAAHAHPEPDWWVKKNPQLKHTIAADVAGKLGELGLTPGPTTKITQAKKSGKHIAQIPAGKLKSGQSIYAQLPDGSTGKVKVESLGKEFPKASGKQQYAYTSLQEVTKRSPQNLQAQKAKAVAATTGLPDQGPAAPPKPALPPPAPKATLTQNLDATKAKSAPVMAKPDASAPAVEHQKYAYQQALLTGQTQYLKSGTGQVSTEPLPAGVTHTVYWPNGAVGLQTPTDTEPKPHPNGDSFTEQLAAGLTPPAPKPAKAPTYVHSGHGKALNAVTKTKLTNVAANYGDTVYAVPDATTTTGWSPSVAKPAGPHLEITPGGQITHFPQGAGGPAGKVSPPVKKKPPAATVAKNDLIAKTQESGLIGPAVTLTVDVKQPGYFVETPNGVALWSAPKPGEPYVQIDPDGSVTAYAAGGVSPTSLQGPKAPAAPSVPDVPAAPAKAKKAPKEPKAPKAPKIDPAAMAAAAPKGTAVSDAAHPKLNAAKVYAHKSDVPVFLTADDNSHIYVGKPPGGQDWTKVNPDGSLEKGSSKTPDAGIAAVDTTPDEPVVDKSAKASDPISQKMIEKALLANPIKPDKKYLSENAASALQKAVDAEKPHYVSGSPGAWKVSATAPAAGAGEHYQLRDDGTEWVVKPDGTAAQVPPATVSQHLTAQFQKNTPGAAGSYSGVGPSDSSDYVTKATVANMASNLPDFDDVDIATGLQIAGHYKANVSTTGSVGALNNYTGSGYAGLNSWLRTGKGSASSVDHYTTQVKALDKLFDKYQMPAAVVVKRGIGGQHFPKGPFEPGTTITDHGYVSTSYASGFGGDVRFEITVPKGMSVISVDGAGGGAIGTGAEKEIILPRGTRFVVESDTTTGGTRRIKAVALPPADTSLPSAEKFADPHKAVVEPPPLWGVGAA